MYINNHIYSDKLIKELVKKGCEIRFDNNELLSDEMIKYLKSNYINSFYYDGDKKVIISDNKVLGHLYKNVIDSDDDKISIKSDINDLENLKLIPKHKKIFIDKIYYEGTQHYDNICKIIKTLR